MNLQAILFDKVLAQFSKKSEAVQEIAELFSMGQNAVYRRLRGESLLTPDELAQLAKQYKISLDAIVQEQSENVLFAYPAIVQKVDSFEKYLHNISSNLTIIQQLPNVLIKYAASEFPFFHYCFFPELIAFKLYTWGKTPMGFDCLADIPFTFDLIAPNVYTTADSLLQQYLDIPSTELWNLSLLDNTLSQIEYYYESGSIARLEDALILCDRLHELLHHLRRMAAQGKKFPVGAKEMDRRKEWKLFDNEMIDTNNTILVTTDNGKAVYSTYGNPNFLKVTDQRVTKYIDQWFDRIMVKSQPLSTHSEKARNQYFNRMLKKVERTKMRLESRNSVSEKN